MAWLKRSSGGFSVFVGVILWIALGTAYTHVTVDGSAKRMLDAIYSPVFRAGCVIGRIVFRDAAPHTTGWYVIPLFGAAAQLVFLIVLCYVGIRLYRLSHPLPVQPDVLPRSVTRKASLKSRMRWEREPDYSPRSASGFGRAGGILSSIDFERFKWRTWRRFREDTGHWPFVTIAFHYAAWVGLLLAIVYYFWLKDRRDWSEGYAFFIAVAGGLTWCVVMVVGERFTRRLDWKLFARQ